MEDDFYGTIKFKNGEEVFAKIAASEETDRTMLVIHHPITVGEVKSRAGTVGYKVEPWLKTTREDMFVVDMDNIITMSESLDDEMILMHQNFSRENSNLPKSKMNRKMGYLSNVKDAKSLLEKIYKDSSSKS